MPETHWQRVRAALLKPRFTFRQYRWVGLVLIAGAVLSAFLHHLGLIPWR